MKVRELVKYLMDFNMDAEVCISTGDTFDDWKDLTFSWGGPNFRDGSRKQDAEFIYVNEHGTESY